MSQARPSRPPSPSPSPSPSPPPASLSRRLVAAALVWLSLSLAVGGWVLSRAFRAEVETAFGHRLDALLRAMIAATDVTPDGQVALVRPMGDPRFDQVFSGWYWQVAEPSGRLVRSRSLWDSTLPVHAGTVQGTGGIETGRVLGPRGERLLVVERDLVFPDATAPVHLQMAGPLEEVEDGTRRFDRLLAAALALLGAGLAVAVLIQVRFGLRPLRALTADLDAVRDGHQARLADRYPREVAPLIQAMNRLLDHDERLIERARTHVGNLAHGLKTPLAILKAEIDGTPDRAMVTRQVATMTRLITWHLGRAAAAAGSGRALGTRTPIRPVAADMAQALGRIFAERRLAITVHVPDEATFPGQREDLEELLGNLMENACKWTRHRIRVTAAVLPATTLSADPRASAPAPVLTLTVEDDGPGLSPADADAAARRGGRLDEMAPGWGLGLSIVADITALYGGSMAFARSDLGGLQVTLSFGPDAQ